jgi:hypothetical protein
MQQIGAIASPNFTTTTMDTNGVVYLSATIGFTVVLPDLNRFAYYDNGNAADKSCFSVAVCVPQSMLFLGCQSGAMYWFDLMQSKFVRSWMNWGIFGLYIPPATPNVLYMARWNLSVATFSIQGTNLNRLGNNLLT